MNKYSGNSENYKSLLLLAESEMGIFVSSESQTSYVKNNELYTESFNQVVIEEDFKDLEFKYQTGNITGETGNLGVTYMPTKGGEGKGPVGDNCIQININPTLSPIGAAETFSHDMATHIYILSQMAIEMRLYIIMRMVLYAQTWN